VFVNDFARSVGEDPSNSIILGWFVDEGTKINGLGGVTFGVLLILFARFVPFGAVGTMRMWRSKLVQVVPRLPMPATEQGTNASVPVETQAASVDPVDTSSQDDGSTM